MTDLNRLTVSLTKQGAYRVFPLLRNHEPEDWVAAAERLSENAPVGQKLDFAQFRKTLSATTRNGVTAVPDVWRRARVAGDITLRQLVLISMMFSHHVYIQAMKNSGNEYGVGRIDPGRDFPNNTKSFTNFRGNLRELGFVRDEPDGAVTFDFRAFFENEELPALVSELLRIKMLSAGWNPDRGDLPDLIEECIRFDLHQVFGLPADEFRAWLQDMDVLPDEDEIEHFADLNQEEVQDFEFQPGHNPRQEEPGERQAVQPGRVVYLHNQLQTQLFDVLVAEYGEERVGTEIPSGFGGKTIDLVLRELDDSLTFFEIKTNRSLRRCIREALAQIMEYSFWPGIQRSEKMVIVSTNHVTDDAVNYLRYIRETFNLPIYYRSFDLNQATLSEEY